MDCSSEISTEDEQTDGLKYFLPNEVVIHNKPDDIWVSFLRRVYDLTPLVKEYDGEDVIKPLLAHAGKDITEWFNPEDNELLQYTHPVTWCAAPYTPHGQLPHLNPLAPTTAWKPLKVTPWWKDINYMIGYLTKCPRPIKIVNVLTGHTDCIQVKKDLMLSRHMLVVKAVRVLHRVISFMAADYSIVPSRTPSSGLNLRADSALRMEYDSYPETSAAMKEITRWSTRTAFTTINVCCEDTLKRIQERFFEYNYHIGSYTWKSDKMVLDMNLNLEQNGILDERKEFNELQLLENFYIPEILIYYNDDLTEA